MSIRVVLFDVMDTLVRDPFREALEAATGRPVREILAARDPRAYPRFERGEITEAEYWAHYTDAGFVVDVAAFHNARRSGYRWIEGMRELLDDLAGVVRRIGATNYPDWVNELTDGMLAGFLDQVVASYEVGARKPDPEFYLRVLDVVGAEPHETYLVDDREVNVEGALEAGLAAHHFTDVAALRAALGQHVEAVRGD
ncbi:MAG: HAD-IA family hydrolase [Actinobacteria bacterium]|nr:HAD-IA family hydrolase [Actinomycetota bacterium]